MHTRETNRTLLSSDSDQHGEEIKPNAAYLCPELQDPNPTSRHSVQALKAKRKISDTILASPSTFIQEYNSGTRLMNQGEHISNVYLILEGMAKLSCSGSAQLEQGVVSIKPQGTLIGATAAITISCSSVTATTIMRSKVATIPSSLFRDFVCTDQEFSVALNYSHAREIDDQLSYLGAMQHRSAKKRFQYLLRILLTLNREDKGTLRLLTPLRYYELAQLVRITPEHFSRVLASMERGGVIRRWKGWIVIQPEAIASLDG